jgi:hypothetical protein
MSKTILDAMLEMPVRGRMEDKMMHYDIYTYEGWTLREVQDPMTDHEYNQATRKWERAIGPLKTTIVWGIHKPCGLSGFINVVTGKASCQKCKKTMPQEVYRNLEDAMEMMKMSLEGK